MNKRNLCCFKCHHSYVVKKKVVIIFVRLRDYFPAYSNSTTWSSNIESLKLMDLKAL